MKYVQRAIMFCLIEPGVWLFYCFFQPSTFERNLEMHGIKGDALTQRAVLMLRLFLPMFLWCYPLALVVCLGLYWAFPALSSSCYAVVSFCVVNPDATTILLSIACTTAAGVIVGVIIGIIGNMIVGISIGFSLGIALGVAQGIPGSIVLGIVFGLVTGVILGVRGGVPLLIVCCTALAVIFGFAGNLVAGIAGGVVGGVALGTVRGITGSAKDATWFKSLAGIITGCIAGNIAWLVLGSVAWFTSKDITWFIEANKAGVYGAIAFVFCYILGSYRLPLYPLSAFSTGMAYFASRQNPRQVFSYLHKSALHWDEHVFVALPGLREILLLAAMQDGYVDQTLQEIAFIVTKRPRQIVAARFALTEIIICELEQRYLLRDVASAADRLHELASQDPGPFDPQTLAFFGDLEDTSRSIAQYYSSLPLSWQARRAALEDSLSRLERISPEGTFKDAGYQKRLHEILSTWQWLAEKERQHLERMLETSGQIVNPYNPGPILELGTNLFVGRRDLVRQLEEALGRGNRRPTFFLYGERRMGKSSTLRQLPDLLGPRYLPITYDLQRRGISSSSAAFLSTVAEEISEIMGRKGMPVKRLEHERLQDVAQENPAATYRLFDEWFRDVERLLEQKDYVLLLAFDEFEKLEEAWRDQYLNLNLLLDWFRSVIQHQPRLALLFSGVRTLSEMGPHWAGYFVNVQTLKVSFLKYDEAQQLVMWPAPEFPGEKIFSLDVVEEILRVTCCQPFLIQAVCSRLVDSLNDSHHNMATTRDVVQAVDSVLENWDAYFRDLWERTDQEQQACLFALQDLLEGDIVAIGKHCGLDETTVRRTLQKLHKRDLVRLEYDIYQIAPPIFSDWIHRNH